MNLQSRELRLNSQGEDVASLHNQLLSMGGSIDAAELAMKLFGNTTRRRVMEFQQRTALPPTGVVDKNTTSALEHAAEGVGVDGLETDAIVSALAANAAAGTGTAIIGGSEYDRSLRELATSVDGQRLGRLEAPEVEPLARETAVPADWLSRQRMVSDGPVNAKVTVSITSPTHNQSLTGPAPSVMVAGTAYLAPGHGDLAFHLDHIDVRLGADGAWQRATGVQNWQARVDAPANGPLRIYAQAVAQAGQVQLRSEIESVDVVVQLADAVPPAVTISAPTQGSTVSGDGASLVVPVTVHVTDNYLGIASITWSEDGIARAHESFATPPRSWDGTRTLTLDASSRTTRTITVTAIDAASNSRSSDVRVTVADVTAPKIRVTYPLDGKVLTSTDPVTVRGLATDQESGVASVQVSLDGGPYKAATLSGDGSWQATVAAATGRHALAARAVDAAGNARPVTTAFEVPRAYITTDPLQLFSRRAYLADLLWFANSHLLDGAGTPLTTTILTDTFLQPFAVLADPLQAAATAPLNQVRAAVEVLRRFLESTKSGLIAHFRFDEGAGTTTADSVTGGAAATLAGPVWAEGRQDSPALLFDGVDDAVQVPSSTRLSSVVNSFTIAFWAFPLSERATDVAATSGTSGTAGQRYAFGPEQGGAAYGSPEHAGVGISVGTNGVSVYEHSDGYLPASLVHDAPISNWTHVAVSYEWQPQDFMAGTPAGFHPVLYLNGDRVAIGRLSPKTSLHCVPAALGRSGYGAFHGRLEDVRIYRGQLFDHQIKSLAAEREYAAAAEHAFLAYQLLLNRIGTSYDELRLIRGADAPTRKALADRLGIDLSPSRPAPDELDRLLLTPEDATESHIAELFGFADTTDDPFATADVPQLLRWRQARPHRLWAEADHGDDAALLVDPDLLVARDFRNPVTGDPAYDVWTARRKWIGTVFDTLRTDREAMTNLTPTEALETLVANTLGVPFACLGELDADRRRGVAVDAQLAALSITTAQLHRLLRLREVAGTGVVTEDEWRDFYHLLTQMQKARQRDTWVAAETFSLTPASFIVSDAPWTPLPWRSTAAQRLDWQDRLQARVEQETAVTDGLTAAVTDVEQATLPRFRDGLITASGFTGGADVLTDQLLVDFAGGGTETTTRVDQAAQTLQELLLALRSGRLPDGHPARAWTVEPGSVASFDTEMQWMGSYDAWCAAIYAFNFPEELLDPSYRDREAAAVAARPTAGFVELLTALGGTQRLRRAVAAQAATDFLLAIRPQLEAFPVRVLPAAGQDIRDDLVAFSYRVPATAADLAAFRSLSSRALAHLGVRHPQLDAYLQELFYYVPMTVAQNLQRCGDHQGALDWYRLVYAYDIQDLPDIIVPVDERKVYAGLEQEWNGQPVLTRGIHWLGGDLNPHVIAASRPNPYTRYTFAAIARCFLEYGNAEFARDNGESRARARLLYLTARELLRSRELGNPGGGTLTSPTLSTLTNNVENQLRKLRQGRNLAGMRRPPDPPETGTGLPAAMPVIGAGGRLVPPSPVTLHPTPYRFTVLIERSRQLVTLAAQVEAAYLSALEKRDAASYDRMRARLDLDLAKAGEQLHSLQVAEAAKATELARRQKTAGAVRAETYQRWLDAGPNDWERQLVRNYDEARVHRDWVAGLDAAITTAQAAVTAASASFGAAGAAATVGVIGGLSAGRAIESMNLNRTEQDIQLATLRASQERRQDEWELQLAIATQDGLVADQSILIAQDHELVVGQEAHIAGMQSFEAQSVADFLTRKFTNAELYEWMSGVLARSYGWFLQQATSVALLAQTQLAFERQQVPPSYVQTDYWRSPDDGATAAGGGEAPDRRGLTGSVRLQQDIERLAQFAFDSDRRKLNLTQTFSLAELAPLELQRFRETGVLSFQTPMSLFDRAFPGHYLRLIKRVRTSLIALVPPTLGIRATLTASGVSRVVAGPDRFDEIVVRRDPESVALTSASNASGVFDLDLQSEMLLPFESMGVATAWEFQLPRVANPFDFRSIADLLFSVDYTALADDGYRSRVVQSLNPTVSADRPYSLRDTFPDAWYELNNPELSDTPMTVRFETRLEDFPPHLAEGSARISQLLLYVAQRPETRAPVQIRWLTVTPPGATAPLPADGSSAARSTDDGIVSTRAGNWNWLGGSTAPVPVAGAWELSFSADVAERFAAGEIEDVLFVITYTARTPAWPDA